MTAWIVAFCFIFMTVRFSGACREMLLLSGALPGVIRRPACCRGVSHFWFSDSFAPEIDLLRKWWECTESRWLFVTRGWLEKWSSVERWLSCSVCTVRSVVFSLLACFDLYAPDSVAGNYHLNHILSPVVSFIFVTVSLVIRGTVLLRFASAGFDFPSVDDEFCARLFRSVCRVGVDTSVPSSTAIGAGVTIWLPTPYFVDAFICSCLCRLKAGLSAILPQAYGYQRWSVAWSVRQPLLVGSVAGNIGTGGVRWATTLTKISWKCLLFVPWTRSPTRNDLSVYFPYFGLMVLPPWMQTWICGVVATKSAWNGLFRAVSVPLSILILKSDFVSESLQNFYFSYDGITSRCPLPLHPPVFGYHSGFYLAVRSDLEWIVAIAKIENLVVWLASFFAAFKYNTSSTLLDRRSFMRMEVVLLCNFCYRWLRRRVQSDRLELLLCVVLILSWAFLPSNGASRSSADSTLALSCSFFVIIRWPMVVPTLLPWTRKNVQMWTRRLC